MECYSTLKKKVILLFATTRIKLEDIIFSQISQTHKEKQQQQQLQQKPNYMILPVESKQVKCIEAETWKVVARGRNIWKWKNKRKKQ